MKSKIRIAEALPTPRPAGLPGTTPSAERRLRLDKAYRKALRAAEMAAWEDPFLGAAARRRNGGELCTATK